MRTESRTRDQLARYAERRSFEQTPEPPPATRAAARGPLLFVVQQHSTRRMHFDFRLELDGVLKSWAIPKGLAIAPGEKHLAVRTEDHPFEYGSFEGVIPPKQYGAGPVIVWDCGIYSPDDKGRTVFEDRDEAERRLRADLEKGKLSFFLLGGKLKGSYALVRTRRENEWLLIKHRDPYTDEVVAAADKKASLLSGIEVEEMRTAAPRLGWPPKSSGLRGSANRCRRNCCPCSRVRANRFRRARAGPTSRSSTATGCSRSWTSAARGSARAAAWT